MSEEERFKMLEEEKIDKSIYYYLKNLFEKLNIEILNKYEGNLFNLMERGKLEGWCWQTTESAALFMDNNANIFRGNLFFNEYKTYYHSFIEFNFEGKKYVFDPCLCLINTSDLYFNIFNVDVKGYVTSKQVKDYFFNYIKNPLKVNNYSNSSEKFMRKFFGDEYYEKKTKEIVIHDEENPYAPMYRNGAGYKNIKVENDKIKSLTVHYYYQ